MPAPIIAYIRVSTDKQGKSGLGLEAQRDAIARFAVSESLATAGEFIEVETGKGADARDKRPQLAAALRKAKQIKAPHHCLKTGPAKSRCSLHFGPDDQARPVHRRGAGQEC